MSSEAFAALGAFLSGAGAVIGALWTMRRFRKQLHDECDERIKLFREGIKLRDELDSP